MSAFLRTLFRRHQPPLSTTPPRFPYTYLSNPYRCKRLWPPDFEQLSPKHQFRLERRYRRRSKLKWARPVWTKAITLVQWGSTLFVVTYGVFYLEVDDGRRVGGQGTVFDGVRGWYGGQVDSLGSTREGRRQEENVKADQNG